MGLSHAIQMLCGMSVDGEPVKTYCWQILDTQRLPMQGHWHGIDNTSTIVFSDEHLVTEPPSQSSRAVLPDYQLTKLTGDCVKMQTFLATSARPDSCAKVARAQCLRCALLNGPVRHCLVSAGLDAAA